MQNRLSLKAFTLIELLLGIAVVGILSGTVVSIINPSVFRNKSKDAVSKTNLEKVVEGIESYRLVEGHYPAAPLNCDAADTQLYFSSCPENLEYVLDATNDEYVIYIRRSSADSKGAKYDSTTEMIEDCTDTDSLCSPISDMGSSTDSKTSLVYLKINLVEQYL